MERTLAFMVLPELYREADSELLATPLAGHLEQTRRHVERVEQVFVELSVEPVAAASPALEGLRRQHDRQVGQVAEPRLRDLFLVDCAARTEAVEQILYDSLLALAATVGAVPGPLEASRDEEADALRLLEGARRELLRLL